MNENRQPVEDPALNALLRDARVSPPLPPRFQQNVWRRIEDTEAPAKADSWLDALAALVFRPKFAMVAAAVVLLAGIFAGTVEGRQVALHNAQMNYLASVVPHVAR